MIRELLIRLVAIAFATVLLSGACHADDRRVWAEEFMGRASTNWNLSNGTTEITEIYLQVVGPSDVSSEARTAVAACAYEGLSEAVQVYYYTVGETGAKFAEALATFKAVFWICVKSIPGDLGDKFNLAVGQKKHSENGLFASARIENPTAVLAERYLIANTPKDAREPLRVLNRVFFPAWSFTGEQSAERLLGFRLPEPPAVKLVNALADFAKALHSPIDVPKINLPEVKLPTLRAPKF
jgi:hypothetical protein